MGSRFRLDVDWRLRNFDKLERNLVARKDAVGLRVKNLFGPTLKCSNSECLGELFFTIPFTASVTYSLGAYIRRLRPSETILRSSPAKRCYRKVGIGEKDQLPISRRIEMFKATNWYDLLRNLAPL